jgi:hypothetical protein
MTARNNRGIGKLENRHDSVEMHGIGFAVAFTPKDNGYFTFRDFAYGDRIKQDIADKMNLIKKPAMYSEVYFSSGDQQTLTINGVGYTDIQITVKYHQEDAQRPSIYITAKRQVDSIMDKNYGQGLSDAARLKAREMFEDAALQFAADNLEQLKQARIEWLTNNLQEIADRADKVAREIREALA